MQEDDFDEEIKKVAKRKPTNSHQKYRCGHCSRKFVTLGIRFERHYKKHHTEHLDKPLKARHL